MYSFLIIQTFNLNYMAVKLKTTKLLWNRYSINSDAPKTFRIMHSYGAYYGAILAGAFKEASTSEVFLLKSI